MSSFRDGVLVATPEECDNVPAVMKLVVQKFIEYINSDVTTLKIYDQVAHTGNLSTFVTYYHYLSQACGACSLFDIVPGPINW